MAEDVALAPSLNEVVSDRQRLDRVRQTALDRLTDNTGISSQRFRDRREINDRIAAEALAADVAREREIRAATEQAIEALDATQAGIEAERRLADQLAGIAYQAQATEDAQARAEFAAQFDQVRRQLTNLSRDTSYQGTNLLDDPAGELRVRDIGLTVAGAASDADNLGIGEAVADYNDFATDADIQAALNDIRAAGQQLEASASNIGLNAAILEVRETFSEARANSLRAGADALLEEDPYAAGTEALAAQTRDLLAAENLRITNRSRLLLVELLNEVR